MTATQVVVGSGTKSLVGGLDTAQKMPKRAPTPETGDDEPIYFSVVNPWPQNANMEVYGDLRLCVQWLVEALGDPNLLMAVFHKPSVWRLVVQALDHYSPPQSSSPPDSS
ncbi:hypothetical protein FRB91_002045 [Serendipita sp. 411]|nr:hypothetical protein FRB91_002045 [Serendipita sp. 411]